MSHPWSVELRSCEDILAYTLGKLHEDLCRRMAGPAIDIQPPPTGSQAIRISPQASVYLPAKELKSFIKSNQGTIEGCFHINVATLTKKKDQLLGALVSMMAPLDMWAVFPNDEEYTSWDLETTIGAFRCSGVDASRFLDALSYFRPLEIHYRHKTHTRDRNYRLPLVEKRYISNGAYGSVYAVRLDRDLCQDLPIVQNQCQRTISCALKLLEDRESAQQEWSVMDANGTGLFYQPDKPGRKFVMMALACIETTHEMYMLYPLAKCNLRQLMSKKTDAPTQREQKQLIQYLGEISCGIGYLLCHLRDGRDNQPISLIHMDIKLQNVLISETPEGKTIAQIADFGNAAIANRQEKPEKVLDVGPGQVRKLLRLLKEGWQHSVAEGEGTYNRLPGNNFAHFPPEATCSPPFLSAASSVWQFGALLAFVLPWLCSGAKGLSEIDQKLQRTPRLFEGSGGETRLRPDLMKYFRELVVDENADYLQVTMDQAYEELLKRIGDCYSLLKETLQCVPNKRSSIEDVQATLRSMGAEFTALPSWSITNSSGALTISYPDP